MKALPRFKSFLRSHWLESWLYGSDLDRSTSARLCLAQMYDDSIREYRRRGRMRALERTIKLTNSYLLDLDAMRAIHQTGAPCACDDKRLRLRWRLNGLRHELAKLRGAP